MPEFDSLEAAIGFITCLFVVLPAVLRAGYKYVVEPLKEANSDLKAERDAAQAKLETLTNKIFEKSGVFDA